MKLLLLYFIVILSLIGYSQDSNVVVNNLPKNNIGINIFGEASLVSVNFERNIILESHHFFNIGIGIGRNEEITLFQKRKKYTTFPHHLTYSLGNKKHFFEIGVGGTGLIANSERFASYYVYPVVGYRFQSIQKGRLFFRAYIAPLFQTNNKETNILEIPAGVSMGITF